MLKQTSSFRSLGRSSEWAEFLFPDSPNYTSTYKYLCLPCSIKIGKEVNPVWTQTKFHFCPFACCSPEGGSRQQQFMWTVWVVLQKYSGTPKSVHWWSKWILEICRLAEYALQLMKSCSNSSKKAKGCWANKSSGVYTRRGLPAFAAVRAPSLQAPFGSIFSA